MFSLRSSELTGSRCDYPRPREHARQTMSGNRFPGCRGFPALCCTSVRCHRQSRRRCGTFRLKLPALRAAAARMTALSGPPNLQSAKCREQTRLSFSFFVSVEVMRSRRNRFARCALFRGYESQLSSGVRRTIKQSVRHHGAARFEAARDLERNQPPPDCRLFHQRNGFDRRFVRVRSRCWMNPKLVS